MTRPILLALCVLGASAAAPVAPAAAQHAEPAAGYDPELDAGAAIDEALRRAEARGTRVLLQWGANWCGLCRALHGFSRDDAELRGVLAEDYELVRVDVGRYDRNLDLAARYGAALFETGIPYLTVLGADGAVLAHGRPGAFTEGAGMQARVLPEAVTAFLLRHRAPPRERTVETAAMQDETLRPVPFHHVRFEGGFWGPRLATNREVTLPYCFAQCEETGRLANFRVAGGLEEGAHRGRRYDDSDVFKVMEGAAYSLATHPDPQLEAHLDEVIGWFAAAQEEDGYLYTARTIDPAHLPPNSGAERWSFLQQSHELYNLGHMFEAAVAHHRVTGKTNFLDVALRAADLLVREFGPGKRVAYPGHQEVEIGLIKLYRVTGERAYLDLAKWFLDVRGTPEAESPDSSEGLRRYLQAHRPPLEQEEAVGHAVRAGYMYAAMADVAAHADAPQYRVAAERLWRDVTFRKTYVTGGIGAHRSGEAFGDAYELPNDSAYAETCAAIAHALWNHRMFLLSGDARHLDVLERILYNGFLVGVSLEGNRFFYPNPLASSGTEPFNQGEPVRAPWFACSCCPVNVVRFLPSIPGMQYAVQGRDVFVCLYQQGTARIEVGGRTLTLRMETDFPWDGAVRLTVEEIEGEGPLEATLRLRMPGWARGEPLPGDLYRYANEDVEARAVAAARAVADADGFVVHEGPWSEGDVVELGLPMPVRLVAAHPKVEADRGRLAVERGPVVYCAEGVDHDGAVADLVIEGAAEARVTAHEDLLGGIRRISLPGWRVVRAPAGAEPAHTEPAALSLVPYYAWAHRGPGAMAVWLAADPAVARPRPQPTAATRATVHASHCFAQDTPDAVHDQRLPESSGDHSIPRHTWWPRRGTEEWLRYDLAEPAALAGVRVYWFDDRERGGGCRVPESWTVEVRGEDGAWNAVAAIGEAGVGRDAWNALRFEPVVADAVRLRVQLRDGFSGGVLEWELLAPEGAGGESGR